MRIGDRTAALSGLAFVVLFGAGNSLWAFQQPASGAGASEIATFFEANATEISVGAALSLISLVPLVWFGAILRDRLGPGTGRLAFAGTVLLAAVGFGAETINAAAARRAGEDELSAEAAQTYFDLTMAFGAQAAGVAMAMVALPVGLGALRGEGALPRWAGWAGIGLGAMLLTPVILQREAFLALYVLALLGLAALSIQLSRPVTEPQG